MASSYESPFSARPILINFLQFIPQVRSNPRQLSTCNWNKTKDTIGADAVQAKSKPPSIVVSALISGLAAAGTTTLVLFFPWWWGWIPVSIGIVAFIAVMRRNPEHWARRTFTSLLSTWLSSRLIPQVPGIVVASNNFFVLITPSDSYAFDIVVVILLISLLAYDAFMRSEFAWPNLSSARLYSPDSATAFVESTSGSAQVANVQHVIGPVTINFSHPLLLEVSDTTRVFATEFREDSATVEPVATFDSEIDNIANYVKEEKSDVAIEFFDRLLKRSSHQLTNRHRFRVSANLGQAYEQKEEYEKAARYYHEAVGFQPDDERARCLEAAAHLLLGDREMALKLSIAVLERFPVSSLGWAVRIRSIAATVPLLEIEQLIPTSVASEVEVLDALTVRACDENPSRAEEYVSRALELHPNMSQLQERLALAKMHHFDPVRGIYDDPRPLNSSDRDKLGQAIALFDTLITKRQYQGNTIALSRLRFNRGMAHRLLGHVTNAVADLREAHFLSPSNADMATRLAFYLWKQDGKQEAISLLDKLNRHSPTSSSRWLHANMLLERDDHQNLPEAMSLLEQCLEDSKGNAEDIASALETLTEALCVSNRIPKARLSFQRHEAQLTDLSRLMIDARIEMHAGNQSIASEKAHKGAEFLTVSTVQAEVMRSVLALKAVKDSPRALSVAKRLSKPGIYSPALPLIFELARECEDHSFMLETCRELRESGVFDTMCLGAELDILFMYDAPDKAIEVLESAVERCTDAKYKKVLRFRLFQIAAATGRQELFQTDIDLLPEPETANPSILPMIVVLLVHATETQKAAVYAYRALRARPTEANAHKAMLAAAGFCSKPISFEAAPSTVQVGCAIRFRALDTKAESWCVIENDPQADSFVREHAPDSAIGREILGKSVGEKFFLRRNSLQDREAEIIDIANVLAFRASDSLAHWEERFPDQPFVQAVRPSLDEMGKPDLRVLFDHLDNRAAEHQRLDNLYRDNVIPIAMFAEEFGSTVPEAVLHLGRQGHLAFRCCRGTDDEVQCARTLLEGIDTCVLDCVALSTIWMTGIYLRLGNCPLRMIVTDGTLKEFRILRAKSEVSGGRRFGSKQDGRYMYRQLTEDEQRKEESQFDEFVQWLKSSTEASDGLALIEFEPTKRNELVRLFGRATAESIATANKRKCLLWTDDFATAEFAQIEIGVGRIWTEIVLRWCHTQDRLGIKDYEDSLISLIAHGYEFTPMFPQLMVTGGQLSDWNPDILPLRRLCEWFGNPNLKAEGLLRLVSHVFLKIWRDAPDLAQRKQITRMIAIQVRKHSSGRKLLETIVANVEKIFPIDLLNAEACKAELESVLRLPDDGSLIVLPW